MNTLYFIFGEDIASLIPHFDCYHVKKTSSLHINSYGLTPKYNFEDTTIYHNRFNDRICIIKYDIPIYRKIGENEDCLIYIEDNNIVIRMLLFDIIQIIPKKLFILDKKLEQKVLFQLNKNLV